MLVAQNQNSPLPPQTPQLPTIKLQHAAPVINARVRPSRKSATDNFLSRRRSKYLSRHNRPPSGVVTRVLNANVQRVKLLWEALS